ncbi:hypothetical protein ACPWSH_11145 [Pandoraea pneumonica]|uniref:hypothetical protein n=1 Tax=Pandoraea pneumonica TaxID=2508299 RepID=UPI003CEE972A
MREYLRSDARWEDAFDRLDTRTLPFTRMDGTRVDVDMMMTNGARMQVSDALPGFKPLVIKRLHHGGLRFSPETTGAVQVLYAMPDPNLRERYPGNAALGVLLDAMHRCGALHEALDFRPVAVDFAAPRFALNVQCDAAALDLTFFHNEDGVRGHAPKVEDSPVCDWHRPDYTVTLDAPFFAVLLAPGDIPLVVAHVANPTSHSSSQD